MDMQIRYFGKNQIRKYYKNMPNKYFRQIHLVKNYKNACLLIEGTKEGSLLKVATMISMKRAE